VTEAPHPTVAQFLDERAAALVGRRRELAALSELVEHDQPLVAYVHGVAGTGKSTLVRAFAARARSLGAAALQLDGADVEPTERGFLAALDDALPAASHGDAASRLGERGGCVVLVLDTAERLALLDDWLRRAFIPSLPRHVRVVLAGREPPEPAWRSTFGELLLELPLGNLEPRDAEALLPRLGVRAADVARVNQVARGHPLSLHLAASALAARPGLPLEQAATDAVVGRLAGLYLEGLDPVTRRALDAAAVVRRPTRSLLRTMLPDVDADDAFARLEALPFARLGADGLVLHETVRDAVGAVLRASDPERRRRLRTAAYRQLRHEDRQGATVDLWRYTADMLYLIDNPLLREALFPAGQPMRIGPARPDDADALTEISALHESAAGVESLRAWFAAVPETFVVARDRDGVPAGYLQMCDISALPKALAAPDPLVAAWREHLHADPVVRGGQVLVSRHYLCRDSGEGLGVAQSALWLANVHEALSRRPLLRRYYIVLRDADESAHAAIGFARLERAVPVDGVGHTPLVLDFGPRSVDGWLAGLVAGELELDDEPLLDAGARRLIVGGLHIPLTELELALVGYLYEREGRAVSRSDLLRDVWGDQWQGGSNVVDVAVSGVRRKLGEHAAMIETVRGVGYRLRDPAGVGGPDRAGMG